MYHNSLFMYSVNIMAFDITVVTCLLKTSILNYLVFVVLLIGYLVGQMKDQASRLMKFLHSKLNSKNSIIIFKLLIGPQRINLHICYIRFIYTHQFILKASTAQTATLPVQLNFCKAEDDLSSGPWTALQPLIYSVVH